jgi:hypothetical protein
MPRRCTAAISRCTVLGDQDPRCENDRVLEHIMRALGAVLFVALAAGSVQAQPAQKIVVFPAEGEVAAPLEDAPRAVTAAIAEAAEAMGAEVRVSAAAGSEVLASAGCADRAPSCMKKVATTLKADIVMISLASTGGGLVVDIDLVARDAPGPVRTSWTLDGADLAAVEAQAIRKAPVVFGGEEGPEPPPEPPPFEDSAALASSVPEDAEAPPGMGDRPETDRGAPSRLSHVKLYSWITAGTGVVLIATGSVLLVGAGNKQDEIDGAPAASLSDFRALEKLEQDASSQALWGNILVGTGLVAAGVGAALVVLQMRSSGESAAVSLAPVPLDAGAGLTLTVVGDL